MVVTMALMTGYREDLQRKIVEGNAGVLIYPLRPQPLDDEASMNQVMELKLVEGVQDAQRVSYGQGILAGEGHREGVAVTLRGVEGGGSGLTASHEELQPQEDGIPGVAVGKELARQLDVVLGDSLRLMALGIEKGNPKFRFRSLKVRKIYSVGYAEFDASWAVISREELDPLVGDGGSRLIELNVAMEDATEVAAQVRGRLGADFFVTDWQELNHRIFSALKLQQLALFLMFGIIVLVSTFNVASTLVILVRERRRDIGTLMALGLPPKSLARVFLVYGAVLALVGCALGLGFGIGISEIITRFELIRFDPEVADIYFLDAVRLRIIPWDLAAITVFTMFVTLISCIFPSRRAARITPADALRYE